MAIQDTERAIQKKAPATFFTTKIPIVNQALVRNLENSWLLIPERTLSI